ncbi:MAG TPA: hypothetical protein VJ984_02680 [Xanthomonadales bacterium]|nr:hypothetical protein [Xanthomonadales bacterium]
MNDRILINLIPSQCPDWITESDQLAVKICLACTPRHSVAPLNLYLLRHSRHSSSFANHLNQVGNLVMLVQFKLLSLFVEIRGENTTQSTSDLKSHDQS